MPSINPPELDIRSAFSPPAGRGSENSSVPRVYATSGLQPQVNFAVANALTLRPRRKAARRGRGTRIR
eukprot:1201488-Pyramimonas_sp.AAC.1